MADPILVWHRLDLRLRDNPALTAAAARGGHVIPVFIWSPDEEGRWQPGAASRWWLHQSLRQHDAALHERGSRLILRSGPVLEALRTLSNQTKARAVFWNRRYEPAIVERDHDIKTKLQRDGCEVEDFNSALLHEPWTVRTQEDHPYQVFSAFWKKCAALPEPPPPHAAVGDLRPPRRWPRSLKLAELALEPTIDWAGGLRESWQPGEAGALKELGHFAKRRLADYAIERDRPDHDGTSRLSPHLHFGEIGPRQVWATIRRERVHATEPFLRELGWREFAYHLLHHFPRTPDQPLRSKFADFPWKVDRARLRAWQQGTTGYPIVDAGMRQLWHTGWMHNRVRMIVASFLVKDLLIPWQQGAAWFWDTLVDADLANNSLGWQWTAGCGVDAAPYFRIFNPTSQGSKFDPDGAYVRRWVPELASLQTRWIHRPWEAPNDVLTAAGVQLGVTYPHPIVDHAEARTRALQAFAQIKSR